MGARPCPRKTYDMTKPDSTDLNFDDPDFAEHDFTGSDFTDPQITDPDFAEPDFTEIAQDPAEALVDKLAIRELVDQWIIASDSGLWDLFDEVWHSDGVMAATWFQANAAEFSAARRKGFEAGVSIIHANLGHISTITGTRAIAQTKMTISQRAPVHGVVVDVVATGRFYDFLEKREGKWGFVRRQPIYEKDRMDPVEPGATLTLDPKVLAQFPIGYRHLAYLQTQIGYDVKRSGMPGLIGPEVELLYAQGAAWLNGSADAGLVG